MKWRTAKWRAAQWPKATDRGAGSVLIVSIVGVLVALTSIVIPSYMALATRQSLLAAADAAALAAADTASGTFAGDPCDRASSVALANGGRLDVCQVDGYVVTVLVSRAVLGIRTTASATAGPPGTAW